MSEILYSPDKPKDCKYCYWYGCVFWQHDFAVQCKYQLTIPLN